MTSPAAVATTRSPIQASVVFVLTSTSAPRPTPAEPPMASWPAMPFRSVWSVAETAIFPPEATVESSSM